YIALIKKGSRILLYLYFSDEDSAKSFIDQTVREMGTDEFRSYHAQDRREVHDEGSEKGL
ncbi:MAG: hypothetical protein J7L50_01780, partial [Candidatus Odinarchaeota archaeon]|nr:hypothetical protein [Candidatus Odinarchaeota archaeon]